jgi:hypothetical protein
VVAGRLAVTGVDDATAAASLTARGTRVLEGLVTSALIIEFALISSFYVFVFIYLDRGTDARIYHRAAEAWLAGGNPWLAEYNGLEFAGPPWTLLFLAPFTLLSEDAYVVVGIVGSLLAAIYTLHRLRLPGWWLLFPPVMEAVTTANPNMVMAALLVAATPLSETVAGLSKVYGIVPALIAGRWRTLVLFGIVTVVTFPLLPWSQFVEQWPHVSDLLRRQTFGGKSALAFLPLVPFVVLALFSLGRERASWLAVPALWPATQFQVNVIALPVIRQPILAATFALPIPLAAPIGIVLYAAWNYYNNRLKHRWKPSFHR